MYIFKFLNFSNLMPNFITKIFTVEFLSNFKVVELEFEFEPGEIGPKQELKPDKWLNNLFMVTSQVNQYLVCIYSIFLTE